MNPLPPLPLVDRCIFVDNSMLELFTTCPRALQYNKLNARISAAESPSLNFGSAIHEALELRYKLYANQPTDPLYKQDVTDILTAFFDQHPAPVDEYRNLNWALEVVRQYNLRYGAEDFNLLQYDQPIGCVKCDSKGCLFCKGTGKVELMVELPFAFPLCAINLLTLKTRLDFDGNPQTLTEHEIGVLYSGRIDLPFVQDEHIFVLDHKTTSVLGPTFFDDKKMSPQQKGYCWSFQKLTGKTVRGFVVNAIRIKEPPQYVTKGVESKYSGKKLTPEQWWHESLQRERFYLNDGELDEWHENTISLVEEFFWNYSRGYFPRKTSWCVGKYGRCQFFDVCSTFPVEDRATMLSSGLFKDNTWSPLISPSQQKQ